MSMQLQQPNDNEINLVDILLFIKNSGRNVLLSILVFLLAAAVYLFLVPKKYEASVTIQMAKADGEQVEPVVVLLEKLKIPLYFSQATLNACDLGGAMGTHYKFVDKFKPIVNKSAPLLTLSVQAKSKQEARACLGGVVGEIQEAQNELASNFIAYKKRKITQFEQKLKTLNEQSNKSINFLTHELNMPMTQAERLSNRGWLFANDIHWLQEQINNYESDLSPPRTHPALLLAPIYVPEVYGYDSWLFIFGLSLVLGVFFGFLITGVMKAMPKILEQMQDAEALAS